MSKECQDACGELATERLRYFTGRHMTARDFRDEQAYHRTHRHLHNRMMHGWGVVCGGHVRPHPNPECRTVIVGCTFAVDCCGREIVIPRDAAAPLIPWPERPGDGAGDEHDEHDEHEHDSQESPRDPRDQRDPHGRSREQKAPAPSVPSSNHSEQRRPVPGESPWLLLLCLHYEETATESVPVLYSEQSCDPQRREASRIREGYRLEWTWVRRSDLPEYFWKVRGEGCEPHDGDPCLEDDCDDGGAAGRCCLDPQCPPGHCVPLALIRMGRDGRIDAEDIDTLGRPALKPPAHALTHVCNINWPHGGVVSRGELERQYKQLRVRFDRRLGRPDDDGPCGPNGVNACTFVVQFGGGFEDLDFVLHSDGSAPHVENDCVAVFDIDPRGRKGYPDERPFAYLVNQIVFITLRCDFIRDCHGLAVDGNHLGGTLPSGDGVAGGTFLSWFRVISDHDWEHREQQQSDQQRPQQRPDAGKGAAL